MSDTSQESSMWREWSEAAASVKQMRARIAKTVDLLRETRDCVVADINYTQAQSFHDPAAVDYLHALLLRVDAVLAKAGADE